MSFRNALIAMVAVLALPVYVAYAGLTDNAKQQATIEPKANDTELASTLTHVHRHCHVVITLGHAKRNCHTHRHNKVAHHGPRYH